MYNSDSTSESYRVTTYMLNRCAVIVHPKKPYLDWAASLDDAGIDPLDGERKVYLLPEYNDDVEAMALLSHTYDLIFQAELENWHLIVEDWPANRTFAMFREWFEVEMHSMVSDLSMEPLVDDER